MDDESGGTPANEMQRERVEAKIFVTPGSMKTAGIDSGLSTTSVVHELYSMIPDAANFVLLGSF